MAVNASVRNTILGHLIAAAAGSVAVVALGLVGAPSVMDSGMSWRRLLAVAASIGLTDLLIVSLRARHPPAGASA